MRNMTLMGRMRIVTTVQNRSVKHSERSIVGGVLEPVWVVMLKKYDTSKSRKWVWLVLTVVFMYLSPMCVGMAMDDMDLGTAYSMWTGMGAVFTMVAGYLLYHERVDRIKVALVFMILVGVVGLHLTAGARS